MPPQIFPLATDRSDIIFTDPGSRSVAPRNYPSPLGLLLSGDLTPAPSVMRLLEGLDDLDMPISRVPTDTYRTTILPRPNYERKIASSKVVDE